MDITEPVFVDTKESAVASPAAAITPKEESSVSAQADSNPAEIKPERKASVSSKAEPETLPPPVQTPPPSKPVKERSSKVRQSLGSSGDESYYPQPSQRRSRGESTSGTSTRQRNRSGSTTSTPIASESSTPTQAASTSSTPSSSQAKTDEQKTLVSILEYSVIDEEVTYLT